MSDDLQEVMNELAEELQDLIGARTDMALATDEEIVEKIGDLVDCIHEKYSTIMDDEEESDTDFYGNMDDFAGEE